VRRQLSFYSVIGCAEAVLLMVVIPVAGAAASKGARLDPAATTRKSGSVKLSLTPSGSLLWRFESLLHREFGIRGVCSPAVAPNRETAVNLPGQTNDCTPLSKYALYQYVFKTVENSCLSLSSRKLSLGALGNNAMPIEIGGRVFTCGGNDPEYLF
jgi:hypothetical protein